MERASSEYLAGKWFNIDQDGCRRGILLQETRGSPVNLRASGGGFNFDECHHQHSLAKRFKRPGRGGRKKEGRGERGARRVNDVQQAEEARVWKRVKVER